MPELILRNEGRAVLRCPLYGRALTVGASPANDVSLPGDVPPWLCSFEPLKGANTYEVISRAGHTLVVDGDETRRAPLREGSEIKLGPLVATFSAIPHEPDVEPAKSAAQRTGILTRRGEDVVRTDLLFQMGDAPPVEIGESGLRVGAQGDNDIVIDDGFVSSFHAQVFMRGERVFVRDLDSTNGTLVDGVRVIEAELLVGSQVTFGQATAQIVAREEKVKNAKAATKGPWRCGELITTDRAFADTFATIERVAPHDATVCILAETGCGKELVAHALHALSARRDGPFVPVNCAAIPETLIESVLFGHEKGAFTGADKAQVGVFEEAHRGTLFLDELGELPLELQAKLLRALESRSVRRLGGHKDIPFDTRIVCATHQDLPQRAQEGKFREDLLHRLFVFPIHLPPLRDRPDDIAHLGHHFVQTLGDGRATLGESAVKKLQGHRFSGNVRELKNVLQRALILHSGDRIEASDIEFIPTTLAETTAHAGVYRPGMSLEDIERQALTEALAAFPSAAQAAKALGMAKSTFSRRAKSLGVKKAPRTA